MRCPWSASMPPSRGLSGLEPSKRQRRGNHWQRFQTGDFEQRWNSSKSIVREGKDAIAPLLELLKDPTADAETHWFTIRALGHFPEPEVIKAIAAQISETVDYPNRTPEQAVELSNFAIETLAGMGPTAVDVLTQLLHQPHQRLLAAKALNQVRSSGVIPALIQVVDDEDARVRFYAIDALGSFHHTTITPVLLAALKDPATPVRKAAVQALGRRPDLQASHQISQQLQPLLWDIDLVVSCQVVQALGRLGADDSIEALQRLLLSEHTPTLLCVDTVRALSWYCDTPPESRRQPDANPAADLTNTAQQAFDVLAHTLAQFGQASAVTQSLSANKDTVQIVVAIVRVLGDLKHPNIAPQATQSLIDCLQTQPAVAVIQAVTMALAGLGQAPVFDALLPLLRHPADIVSIHAIAALKRLDPKHSRQRVTAYLAEEPDIQTNILNFW